MRFEATQTVGLVGRDAETGLLDRQVESVRAGHSAVLRITGEPGIGKTALIGYAITQAVGWLVLATQGVEADADMAFGTLAELVGPLSDRISLLPPSQAASLAGAIGLGPPTPGDPLAVAAATFGLLSAAAEDGPMVVAVDDAQWVDAASGQALRFAARRMTDEPVLMLIGERDTESSPFAGASLPELELSGVDEDSARAMIAMTGVQLAPVVADQLLETARGNPLALQAIPPLLDEAERAGQRQPLPLPPGEALTNAYRRRLDGLPEQTRQVLVVIAAGGGEPEAATVGGEDALADAEQSRLIQRGATLQFLHPLIRSVVYHDASPEQRRAAHRLLAESMEPSARQAWHRALAATEPDEAVAGGLEQAAFEWRMRGAFASSAAAFEAAARLSRDEEARARRQVEAGKDMLFAGDLTRAPALLQEAEASSDPRVVAEALCLRARCAMFKGDALGANALLWKAAADVEHLEPSQAAMILAEAASACTGNGEFALARTAAERARELAEPEDAVAGLAADVSLYGVLQVSGRLAEAGALLDRLWPALERADPLGAHHLVGVPVLGNICHERYDRAQLLVAGQIGTARRHSAISTLPIALVTQWNLDFRLGNWAQAEAVATEGAALAEQTGRIATLPWLLAALAVVDGACGRARECRAHAGRARAVNKAVRTGVEAVVGWSLGLLESGNARTDEAIGHFEHALAAEREHGYSDITLFPYKPDLIGAYARVGRIRDAEQILAEFEKVAEGTSLRYPRATAARCRGLLADDDNFESEFATAMGWHHGLRMPFEQARTELCLGERRVRARRRADARDPLRSALATFERLGADPWAETARRELRATGLRIRSPRADDAERLTPRELEIALKVAEGSTNREVAASLFLSLKTVEHHLRVAYRKLGVRSRSQLAGLVAEHDPRLRAYPE